MNTLEFLSTLRGLDVRLAVEGERLKIDAPQGVLSDALREELRARKEEILAYLRRAADGSGGRLPPIAPAGAADPAPLSVSQERIWSLVQFDPANPLYNMYMAFRVDGELDCAVLEEALNDLVGRHEALHTRFTLVDGQPRQVIEPAPRWTIPLTDLQGLDGAAQLDAVDRLVAEETGRPFVVDQEPLLRLRLLRLHESAFVLVIAMHHLIADGRSWEVLLRDLGALYTARVRGERPQLPELPLRYIDYAVWQQALFEQAALDDQLRFWQEQLAGEVQELELPTDFRLSSRAGDTGSRLKTRLCSELTEAVRAFSRQEGSTLFLTLLTAFDILLHAHSGQTDLIVCTPVACRHQPGVHEVIGYFNNLVLLRQDLAGGPSFRELLDRVRDTALAAYENQDVPIQRLVELPNLLRVRLTRAMFAIQESLENGLVLDGLQVEALDIYNETANFDLYLSLIDRGEELEAVLEYKPDLFKEETIRCLLADFAEVLQTAVDHPNRPLGEFLPGRRRLQLTAGPASAGDFLPPRTGVEAQLARIWEEMLQVRPIGVRDDFFALGGHSLLALRLFGKIEREIGANLPLSALLKSPTIEYLARLIDHPDEKSRWSYLVPIQPLGQKPPFFAIHGADGNVLFWRNIVSQLETNQPFYGLQAPGVDGRSRTVSSIERMAGLYLAEMRQVQPRGPYYLGGYSMGGEVAFEIAQQLGRQGEEVALLVLFDTSNPVRPVRPHILGDMADEEKDRLLHRTDDRIGSLRRKLQGHLERLAPLSPAGRWRYLWADVSMRARRLRLRLLVSFYHGRGRRLPDDLLLAYLSESHLKAVLRYVPTVYPGVVTLFRAAESLVDNPADSPMGWLPLAEGGLDVHVYDGSHQIYNPKLAVEIGSILNRCLAAAQARGLAAPG